MTTNSNSAATSARGPVATEKTLTLRLNVSSVKGEGYLCEAGDGEHDAIADWVVDELRDSDAQTRFFCDAHLKAANKDSGLEARLTEIQKAIKARIDEAGTWADVQSTWSYLDGLSFADKLITDALSKADEGETK